jgi:hypothetical protein
LQKAGLREGQSEPRFAADVQRLESCLVETIERGDALDANALLFLLRRYQLTLRDDLGDAVGRALALATSGYGAEASVEGRSAWLALFAEASTLSDDERIGQAMADLVTELREAWRSPSIEQAMSAIGACLHAAAMASFPGVAPDAIDQLEHVVGAAYRPGASFGSSADQVRAAFALLVAYTISGRLPYAMLAEELIQPSRAVAPSDFIVACEAARVLTRLASLHDDSEYRAAAVTVPAADYRGDAERLLRTQSAEAERRGAGGGIYGVAMLELESHSQSEA